ncbi:TetR/AcrR family transcriptional regulator [Frondihabitans cladoniiphilus]|uniref:TetR/AcrR family transcriptional regulator n=1 Tax=Frondihabitans cladoniiphilus TaxID=715785 RepID=A0ABP8W5H1_9MICO
MTTSESPGTPRGPYAKGVQRRREILDRALGVFAEKGSESTSLRAIGEAIGVSHGVLTHYFASREALLVEVLRERDEQARAEMGVAGSGGVLGSVIDAVEGNREIPGIVALHTILMGSAVETGHDAATEFFTERFARNRRDIVAQVRSVLAEQGLPEGVDLDAFASLLMAASDGLQIQWLLDDSVDISASLRQLELIVAPRGSNPAPPTTGDPAVSG